ncbi:TetR/AcrR family transcriptional regulator [Monashia sp. NPDC004114]
MNSSSRQTRTALIASARSVLAEHGYSGATARRIATHASTNQALVFYHFGSVDGLLLAALDDVSERRMATFGETIEQATTIGALLEAVNRVIAEDTRGDDVAILVAMLDAGRGNADLARAVAERLAPWQALTERALARALGAHPMGVLVPVPLVARVVMATVLGLELLEVTADPATPQLMELIGRARALVGPFDSTTKPTRGTS